MLVLQQRHQQKPIDTWGGEPPGLELMDAEAKALLTRFLPNPSPEISVKYRVVAQAV